MKLLLNCISLHEAGGLTVGYNLAKHISEFTGERLKLYLAAPSGVGYEALANEKIHVITYRRPPLYPLWRFWFDQTIIPVLIRKHSINVLLTMTNIPTWRPGCPQLLLLQRPHFVYPETLIQISKMGRYPLKDRLRNQILNTLFRLTLNSACHVVVQTLVMKNRLCRHYHSESRYVSVVPSAGDFGFSNEWQDGISVQTMRHYDGNYKLLCLSRYYPHKNIEILIDVARIIKNQGRDDIKLFITIEGSHHPNVASIFKRIQAEKVGDIIINLGAVPPAEVPLLYQASDAFIIPTLMESYGLIYDEARRFGKPILTSDLDFARQVLGDQGNFFDPLSPESILESIDRQKAVALGSETQSLSTGYTARTWGDTAASIMDIVNTIGSVA